MSELPPIDWNVAVAAGGRFAPPGPVVRASEARATVADLRGLAAEAHGHAVAVTGLADPGGPAPTDVVSRQRWVELNCATARAMLGDLADARDRAEWSLAEKVQGRAVGSQAGFALGWMSAKVIGQYDPFAGRLLLVAPNVIATERGMGVDPHDFRLWVAVHEQTHRLQFASAPWLVEHLTSLLRRAVTAGGEEPASASARPRGIIDLLSTRAQRRVIDEVTAVMSVLEGYAEVMMDRVGPDVIATVATIRPKFQARREVGGLDAVMRRLLGMDTKMAQYKDGAAFCRAVIDRVGVGGLNRVFTAVETLPDYAELMAPERWLARLDRAC